MAYKVAEDSRAEHGRMLASRIEHSTGMRYPTLFKRLLASGFVLVGGVGIVLTIWPDGITELVPEDVSGGMVARAIGAVAAAAIGVLVLLTLWDE